MGKLKILETHWVDADEKEINRLQTDIERLKNEYSANDLEALKAENETLKALMTDLISAIKAMSFTVNTTGTAAAQSGSTTLLNNS